MFHQAHRQGTTPSFIVHRPVQLFDRAIETVQHLQQFLPATMGPPAQRQALQFLQTGNVDAGIIALSVADVPEVRYTVIDASLHTPLLQAAAVTARARHPALARAFIRFVNGPQGRPIMKRFGFLLPGEF